MSGNNEHAPSPAECRECSEDKLQLRGSALENEERIGKIEQELNPEPVTSSILYPLLLYDLPLPFPSRLEPLPSSSLSN